MPRPFHRVIDSRWYNGLESFLPSKNKHGLRGPCYSTNKQSVTLTNERAPLYPTIPILGHALQHGCSIHFAGTSVGFRGRRRRRRFPLATGNSPPRVENCEVKCVTGRRGGNRRDGESMSSFLVVTQPAEADLAAGKTSRFWPVTRILRY